MSAMKPVVRHPNVKYQLVLERKYFQKLTFQETKLFHEAIKEVLDRYLYDLNDLYPYKSRHDPYNDSQHLKRLDYFICSLRDIEEKADRDRLCAGGFW